MRPGRAACHRASPLAAEAARLTAVSGPTVAHYDARAEVYREHTLDHDVGQNRAALLDAIDGPPPHAILDLGCGPGRDLRHFRALGHEAVGVEGSPRLAAMARAHARVPVLVQDFLALDLPEARFDGVFTNAALFHVPSRAMPRVLADLHAALRPGGVLFSSNPRGNDEEGWADDRYCGFYRLRTWRRLMRAAGFAELGHYYRPPGLPRREQGWLATLWRKPAG